MWTLANATLDEVREPLSDYRQVDFRNVTAAIRLPRYDCCDTTAAIRLPGNDEDFGYRRISGGKGTVTISGQARTYRASSNGDWVSSA